MKTLYFSKNSKLPMQIGKLLRPIIIVTINDESSYEIPDSGLEVQLNEGQYRLEFKVSLFYLFFKIPSSAKTVKTVDLTDDMRIKIDSFDAKEVSILVQTIENSISPNENSTLGTGSLSGSTAAQSDAPLYSLVGEESRTLKVFDDRVEIKTKPSLLASYSGNGVKTIYYSDCIGIQFKPSTSGHHRGFLQLETAGMQKNENNYYSENSFVWSIGQKSAVTNEQMEQIKNFIQKKLREYKTQPTASTVIQQASSADELKKFKELLDSEIITQEEFDAKKKQLLGL